MRILYHLSLDPFCRKLRLILREKGLDFELKAEKPWERREGFLKLNPAGEVPVLIEKDGTVLADHWVIAEYLNEAYPDMDLVGKTPLDRAEVRRLANWFDGKFQREVTMNLVNEKLMKRLLGVGGPNSQAIRAGHSSIHYHLDYIGWLAERRKWLAGDYLSLADLAGAAHLSAVDYLGDVPWSEHEGARDWYQRVKSRPSFRPLLGDAVPGVPAAKHYADLDF